MKKLITLIILILMGSLFLHSQVPQAMTYKAIAKDDWGVSLPNKAITLRFTILQGGEFGAEVYQEIHSTVTNKFGLMDVQIGKGTSTLGTFESIDWSAGNYYIKIAMDPKGGSDFRLEDPAHQLLSVPYALYAGNVQNNNDADSNPQNELISNASLQGTILYIVEGNQTTFVDLAGLQDGTEDADADATNELQNLSVSDHELTISDGNTVTLPDNVNDADADANNEIQDLQLAGNILTITKNGTATQVDLSVFLDNTDDQQLGITDHELSIERGNTITLPDNVDDADANPQNELQDIELTDNTLSLTQDATPVDLSKYLDNTDNQQLEIDGHELTIENGNTLTLPDNVDDADNDPQNELQVLSVDGHELTLSNGNTITLPDEVNDADNNPVNEIQVLSLENNLLTLSTNGEPIQIDLSSYLDNTDAQNLSILDHMLTIHNGNTIQLPDSVNDADHDPVNELIMEVNLEGTNLNITDAGGTNTVDLGPLSSGTGTQTLSQVLAQGNDANEMNIINLANPLNSQDAATKAYVDELEVRIAALEASVGSLIDNDGDGFKISQGDCNDSDPAIYPGSTEFCGDGKDNDCDGQIDEDCSDLCIGQNYGGGIVFYIDETGQHGLVCAPTDQSTNAQWVYNLTLIAGADGTAVGTGYQNTIDIVNVCSTAGIAARICYDLELNGYDNWFLPSKDELNLIWVNLHYFGFGNFGGNYWSSSENSTYTAWYQNFSTGNQYIHDKYSTHHVRAVRAF